MWRYIVAAAVCLLAFSEDADAAVLKQYENVSDDVTKKISFFLFTKTNKDVAYSLVLGDEENYKNSPYTPENPTIFFIHGFGGRGEGTSGRKIRDAYLGLGDFNVILVDWKRLAKMPWYNDAIRHSALVGKHTAAMVKWLEYKEALSIPALHIIGFSLGAHVSAFVGEELAKNQTELIGRITGLDPAGPAFDKFSIQSNGLGKEDAAFVDVIHTNSRFLGLHLAIGHADFYVNYGRSQPGCGTFTIKCSHYRAWEYYAESVQNPCGFPADTCTVWKPAVSGCQRNQNVLMGIATSKETRGIYVVETNSQVPFAKVTTKLDDMVKIRVTESTENHRIYTVAQEAELGLADLAHYCSGDKTKLKNVNLIDSNVIGYGEPNESNDMDNNIYTVINVDKR